MGHSKNYRSKKRKFTGNRFTNKPNVSTQEPVPEIPTASSSKLRHNVESYSAENSSPSENKLFGSRIMDMQTLIIVFSALCCPLCYQTELTLEEDSRFGLNSNFCLKCKNCEFAMGFSSTKKLNQVNVINVLAVYALRLIGKGYLAGKKLFCLLDMPFMSKVSFRKQEIKLLKVAQEVAQDSMNNAAKEILSLKNAEKNTINCGVSVDGTWQKRGYSSLNGCVSCISIDTGKVLDVEILSQFCRFCDTSSKSKKHTCKNHKGSASSMETVGVYRIFERSENLRKMRYTDYYGDGDSKAFETVKDMYGKDSVTKLECIGHVQKRVGSRLRKLKKCTKGLGGKGKLTDRFIDRLQNYYGIAIRTNNDSLQKMQSAVIAAFYHCCSSSKQPMHGQCPTGIDSWCKYQRAKCEGNSFVDKSSGIPQSVINAVKPVYMQLCEQKLLKKCLHGKTQNTNECFNGMLWSIIPKQTFTEMETLKLGTYIAVLNFNDGSRGLLSIIHKLGLSVGTCTLNGLMHQDAVRIFESKRHSLPHIKTQRKKLRASRKKKGIKAEEKEGLTYKPGEF